MKFLSILFTLLALCAAFAFAADQLESVVVSYQPSTPEWVLQKAKDAIRKAVCLWDKHRFDALRVGTAVQEEANTIFLVRRAAWSPTNTVSLCAHVLLSLRSFHY